MAALNILIADDHTLVSRGVRRILEEQPDWHVVAEAADGRDAVRLGTELKPHVAVMDVSMPSLNGIEATAKLAEQAPATKVLMLSMHSDEVLVGRALRAGARGFLLKDSADAELVRAVAAVANGESFFSHAVATRILAGYVGHVADQGTTDRFEKLSTREREVFQLVVEGKSSRQIAEILGIRQATVETHRAHIFEKLDVHSTAELVRYAARRGVIA
jgi:two-component system, NarL family, response regulator NreC